MALVVFLKGVNVGGHRRFRPSEVVSLLKRYDIVNVGAAGTFVVRKPITRTKLRGELKRLLPFDAEIMICSATDILRLAASDTFAGTPSDRSVIQFVSILARRHPSTTTPISIPPNGQWGLQVLRHQ